MRERELDSGIYQKCDGMQKKHHHAFLLQILSSTVRTLVFLREVVHTVKCMCMYSTKVSMYNNLLSSFRELKEIRVENGWITPL